MTSTETATPEAEETEAKGWDWFDTCGLIAGALLIVILADIFTDGRIISRRLRGQPAPQDVPEPEQVPGE